MNKGKHYCDACKQSWAVGQVELAPAVALRLRTTSGLAALHYSRLPWLAVADALGLGCEWFGLQLTGRASVVSQPALGKLRPRERASKRPQPEFAGFARPADTQQLGPLSSAQKRASPPAAMQRSKSSTYRAAMQNQRSSRAAHGDCLPNKQSRAGKPQAGMALADELACGVAHGPTTSHSDPREGVSTTRELRCADTAGPRLFAAFAAWFTKAGMQASSAATRHEEDERAHALFQLGFHGDGLSGWQEQSPSGGSSTVQAIFRQALLDVLGPARASGEAPVCRAASRLDAGVSSDALLVHAALPVTAPEAVQRDPARLLAALNAALTRTLVVRRVALRGPAQVIVQSVVRAKTYSYYLRVGSHASAQTAAIGAGAFFCSAWQQRPARGAKAAGGAECEDGGAAGAHGAGSAAAAGAEADPMLPPAPLPAADGRFYTDPVAFAAAIERALMPAVGEHDFVAMCKSRRPQPGRQRRFRRMQDAILSAEAAGAAAGTAAALGATGGGDGGGDGENSAGDGADGDGGGDDGSASSTPRTGGVSAVGQPKGCGSTVRHVLSVSARHVPVSDLLSRVEAIRGDREAAAAWFAPSASKPSAASEEPLHDHGLAAGARRLREAGSGGQAGEGERSAKRARRLAEDSALPDALIVRVDVRLRGALRYMVRALVGAAVAQVTGRMHRGSIQAAIEDPARFPKGLFALGPSRPLWLSSVETEPEDLFAHPSAQLVDGCIVQSTPRD